jgi:hypothetical protein
LDRNQRCQRGTLSIELTAAIKASKFILFTTVETVSSAL